MTRSFQRLPAVTALLCMLLLSCGTRKEKEQTASPVKVSVLPVQAVTRLQQLSYAGSIEADNVVQVGFAVPGIVNEVAVQEGQHVHAGQLLAGIDATEYSNALAIAAAALRQTEDLYERLNGLYSKGSLPAKDYMEIKSKLAQATASKNLSAKRLSDTRLYAPMQGIITAKMAERGSTAAPGITAFTLAKTDQVYATVTVPESEVGALRQGQKATVCIPTLRDTLTGSITIINPQADNASRTYHVKIRLPNNKGRLLPGMLSDVRIVTGHTTEAIVIPTKAIVRDADDLIYVFIVNEHQQAVRKRITTGDITGNNEILVTGGLHNNDKVIIAGQSNLNDGSPVSL